MTYLIVGLDSHSHTPWHANVKARDVTAAKRIARARACALGMNLVVAGVIGPGSRILPHAADGGLPAEAA